MDPTDPDSDPDPQHCKAVLLLTGFASVFHEPGSYL
jgi:hypothetical protein